MNPATSIDGEHTRFKTLVPPPLKYCLYFTTTLQYFYDKKMSIVVTEMRRFVKKLVGRETDLLRN